MSLILSGTDGLSDVDGTAATPAIRGTDANTGIFFPAADTIAFAEGGAECARFDSSGNFGLGVTPSAWSNYKAIQMGSGVGLASYTAGAIILNLGTNQYYNGTDYVYVNTDFAASYQQTSGIHKWWTAPSGTAGNAITLTQAMTLDASGNLLVGSTSADAKLHVNATSGTLLKVNNPNVAQLNIGNGGNSTNYYDADTQIFRSGGGSERARIDSSGNLFVNTTTSFPGDGNTTTGFMIQASVGGKIFASVSAGNEAGSFNKNDNGTLIKMNRSGTQVGSISVTASATAYNTSSDYRLKNTIAPMTGALAKVALLKPVTYKWNLDGSDGQGFIAHELQEVVEGCVTGAKDAVETYTDEDGNEATRPVYQGIDTSFLVATLTAAIQEQQALITTLTARITALESA